MIFLSLNGGPFVSFGKDLKMNNEIVLFFEV